MERRDELEDLLESLRKSDNFVAFFSVLGLILIVATQFYIIDQLDADDVCDDLDVEPCREKLLRRSHAKLDLTARDWLILLLSIASLVFFCRSQRYRRELMTKMGYKERDSCLFVTA